MVNSNTPPWRQLPLRWAFGIGAVASIVAAIVVLRTIDVGAFRRSATEATSDPTGVAIALAAFGAAFALRAVAWTRAMPALSFRHALAGIHVALGANHILPFRLGEPFRVVSVVRREKVGLEAATASTLTLRAADILAVVGLGLVVAPSSFSRLLGWVGWICVVAVAIAAVVGWRWMSAVVRQRRDVAMPNVLTLLLATSAWGLEAVLVWKTAHWAGIDASWSDALLVTTVAVAAQIAAIAPGGFGTYEAAAVAAYVTLGHDAGDALVAAIGAHALKTAYSLVAGASGALFPAPSLLGRLRLDPTHQAPPVRAEPPRDDAPVLLFMPAFNEEDAVADCVRRCPADVVGRPVDVLIIDDGSSDATVERAREAGAEVISLPQNQGLGAAVRFGLQTGVDRGAAVVVFCDADGEYPPEELANLVEPILDDRADYVAGSRFLGRIDHMRPHRRIGNLVLTRILSIIARRRISDGQTGYRAFSPAAAASAEVIHDFNYAQVITLDLLGKGFRYQEVPISYHFRMTGESFISLGPYLRRVVPAVYRELNAA
jgi:uncharacterized membrane protein YbhN (UPF0104 family)